jgi:hypothetical protein
MACLCQGLFPGVASDAPSVPWAICSHVPSSVSGVPRSLSLSRMRASTVSPINFVQAILDQTIYL